jgi:hypothetical protein
LMIEITVTTWREDVVSRKEQRREYTVPLQNRTCTGIGVSSGHLCHPVITHFFMFSKIILVPFDRNWGEWVLSAPGLDERRWKPLISLLSDKTFLRNKKKESLVELHRGADSIHITYCGSHWLLHALKSFVVVFVTKTKISILGG